MQKHQVKYISCVTYAVSEMH